MLRIQVTFENSEIIKFLLDEILEHYNFKESNNLLIRNFYDIDEFNNFDYDLNHNKYNLFPYTTKVSLD